MLFSNDLAGGGAMPDGQSWKYLNKPGFDPRPLRICIAGAGASGICLAIKLLEAQQKGFLRPLEFVIFERDDDFGGTWHANRYPGCRCDIPSHVYQFSFAPYSDWSKFYSPAPEIKKYLHRVVHKYKIAPYIRLNHRVAGASFSETTGKWSITVETGGSSFTDEFDVYVLATGVLSQVNRPNIKGLERFTKNPILHTAEWPKDLDYTTAFKDETVAVIGIGSSGVQTVGAIAPFTKSVEIFARSKFWVSPEFMTEPAGPRDWVLGNFDCTRPEEKDLYARNPAAFHKHTRALTAATMTLFDIFVRGSENQKHVRALVEATMREDLRHDPELIDKIIPDFDVWCRRVTPCAPFIDALHRESVTLDKSPILEVTEEGIVTAEGLKKVDRIILATGFDTSFRPRYPIEAKGKSLAEVWAKRPKCYMSVAVTGFPNLFFMCGPGTIFANGSLLAGVEANSGYIVEALHILQQQDVLTMEVDRDAQNEYNEQQDSLMEDLVFSGSCSSWYKGGDPNGKPDALFAGSTLQFIEMLSRPRWQDWHFRPLYENRFSFLGNGTGTVEATGGDRAWYIQEKDHVEPLRADDPLA